MEKKFTRHELVSEIVRLLALLVGFVLYIPIKIVLMLHELIGVFIIVFAVGLSVWGFVNLHIAWALLITLASVITIYICHTTHTDSDSLSIEYASRISTRLGDALLSKAGISLKSARIHLRPVVESDIPVFFEHLQHPPAQLMAAFIHEDPSDRAAHDAHWAKLLASDDINSRSIELATPGSDPTLVGHIISFSMEGDREITYWIDHNHWGKGIATAALQQFLTIEKTRPLYGRAAKDNTPSIRVMERCAFRHLRDERGYAHARGSEIDEVVMVLGR